MENSWSFMPPPTLHAWRAVVVIPAAAGERGVALHLLVEAGCQGLQPLNLNLSLSHAKMSPQMGASFPGP